MTDPADLYQSLHDEVSRVLIGNEEIIEGITVSLLTRGHILLEGVPGVAKTTIANLVAEATGLDYNRIQMTPDLLPADITGTYIYQEGAGDFDLRKGPVFSNVVVADEINRATPKTQSALLEAMQEDHVSIESETFPLPEPFIVIATQNPIEMEGTFELPEAQRDRFQLKLTVETPDREDETELLDRFDADPTLGPDDIDRVITHDDVLEARKAVENIYVDETVKSYILDIVHGTRDSDDLAHGASPRASLAFLNAGKARAAIQGREYVIPEDIKTFTEPILAHRVVLSTDAELSDLSAQEIIADIVGATNPPSREAVQEAAPAVGDGGGVDAPDSA